MNPQQPEYCSECLTVAFYTESMGGGGHLTPDGVLANGFLPSHFFSKKHYGRI